MLWARSCGDIITTHQFSKPYKPKNESYQQNIELKCHDTCLPCLFDIITITYPLKLCSPEKCGGHTSLDYPPIQYNLAPVWDI